LGTRATTIKSSASDVPSRRGSAAEPSRRHDVVGIVALAFTVLTALALTSYDAAGGTNWIGAVGHGLANLLTMGFGLAAWVIPFELASFTVRVFTLRPSPLGLANLAATLVLLLVGCALVHLSLPGLTVFGSQLPGGMVGEVFGELLRSLFGPVGAYVVGLSVLLTTLVLRTTLRVTTLTTWGVGAAWRRLVSSLSAAQDGLGAVAEAWREAKELERREREAEAERLAPRVVGARDDEDDEDEEYDEDGDEEDDEAEGDDDEDMLLDDEEEDEARFSEDVEEVVPEARARPSRSGRRPAVAELDEELEADADEQVAPAAAPVARSGAVSGARGKKAEPAGPTIVAPSPEAAQRPAREPTERVVRGLARPYELPATTLLEPVIASEVQIDSTQLKQNAARLVEKLEAYGVFGRVDEIHPGPVVTMYEFEPKSGTKVSKIAGLADDLAMSLAAQKVRIVAPIPGKARVGFELPNAIRQTVSMRQIIEDERWEKQTGPLPIALGKDIGGQPVYGDLSKMPHLLVAGATGAGKSVGLNVMLASLLFKRTPEEVRLLMIDPKVVELAVYDGIPHMLLPVVTDMKKASLALRWAVDEMERRYQLFADAGARNVTTYNQRVDKVISGEMTVEKLFPSRAGKVRSTGSNGEDLWLLPEGDEQPDPIPVPDKLPYIVVVVDEFADLMMVAAKDVESAIARLAQKARAAGIHVILATQRPSVDVITGMIKANFPARIAFKVSQREDSKTILGRQGAEHLLGMGDMLMIPPGASDLKRVHSAYISEDEVKELCDFLRAQGKPVYDENILKPRDEDGDGGGFESNGPKSDDPQYDKAVAIVAQAGYCSISHLQRQLGIGYNKAAKLVERMEKDGVVGPASGKAGGRRDVLVQSL
jgi:S-DNA-T family DNA segregation ATPase FtsK/SpoIIIE